MAAIPHKGSEGNEVRELQQKLAKLGYDIDVDGKFGPVTDWAVKNLQAMFGYNVDGMVGPGTIKLMDSQIGYGWNAKSADAQHRALQAQGLIKG